MACLRQQIAFVELKTCDMEDGLDPDRRRAMFEDILRSLRELQRRVLEDAEAVKDDTEFKRIPIRWSDQQGRA